MRTFTHICLLVWLLGFSLAAQSTLALSGPATVRPGGTLNLNLNVTSTPTSPISGLAWTLGLPPGYTTTGQIGAAGTAASKSLYCAPGDARCLVIGMNQTAVGNGVVASYSLQVPQSAVAGLISLPLTDLSAGSGEGVAVPLVSGPVFSFRVIPRQDINGDGTINSADVLLMVDQALGKTSCTADQNDDGQCRLIDVLLVIFTMTPAIP